MTYIEIPLTRGGVCSGVALVSPEDAEWIGQWKWHARPSGSGTIWYAVRIARINCRRQMLRMHRVILDAPAGMVVDHINDNGLDNRRDNIRLCTLQQNTVNSRRFNLSGFKGVTSTASGSSRWRARIYIGSKAVELGYFAAAEEAARAYDRAAIELHGEFARLNFPKEPTP